MKINLQLTAIAALLGISGIAQAALTTSTSAVNFSGSASVTATASSASTATANNNGATIATVSLGQFDSSLGVLTGTNITLNSDRTQSISGAGNKNQGPGRTANGSGTSTAALSAPGVTTSYTPAITVSGSGCGLAMGPTSSSCSWGPSTSNVTTPDSTESVSSGSLNSYVGNGTVNAALTLPNLSATSTLTTTMGGASQSVSTYTVGWSGSLKANYSYLLHALASFDGSSSSSTLTLDFGNVAQNSTAALAFSLYNLGNADRIGLDLDSVSANGDTSAFSSDLATFANLAQGGSQAFVANLLTTNVGAFSAQYLLNLSDADFGASSTRQNHQLTLNLIGNVTAVPLPGAVWLFGSAFMGLLGVSRRKQSA